MNKYEKLGAEVGRICDEKNRAYGSSFHKAGEVMRILYPSGVQPEQLDDALTIVRMLDKLFRIATDRDALGESPYSDLLGYSLLALDRVNANKAQRNQAADNHETHVKAFNEIAKKLYNPLPVTKVRCQEDLGPGEVHQCLHGMNHKGEHENATGATWSVGTDGT